MRPRFPEEPHSKRGRYDDDYYPAHTRQLPDRRRPEAPVPGNLRYTKPPNLQLELPVQRVRKKKPLKKKNITELIAELTSASVRPIRLKPEPALGALRMRPWYLSLNNWCSAAESTTTSAAVTCTAAVPRLSSVSTPKTPNFISRTAAGVEVPSGASEDATCAICGDELHKTYHSKTHKWIYDNTLRNVMGAIVHIACDKDYDYSYDGSPSSYPSVSPPSPRQRFRRRRTEDVSLATKRFRYV